MAAHPHVGRDVARPDRKLTAASAFRFWHDAMAIIEPGWSLSRMLWMRMVRALAILVLLLAGPTLAQTAGRAPPCDVPDARWAGTPGQCSTYLGFGPERAETLVVVLHGDMPEGGPGNYHFPLAERIAGHRRDLRVVALVRPGYDDGEGRTSDGRLHGRYDHYTAANTGIVANAVQALKARAGARRVVLVGHSGGALTAANLLGLHPGLADAAVLVSCHCALSAWRAGQTPWNRSVDPVSLVSRVPATARVVALTGTGDAVTAPEFARAYVAALQQRGIDARFREVPGAGHNDVLDGMWAHGFPEALDALL
jgi:pimeloyl-ACP methyl ester carboxylesterase